MDIMDKELVKDIWLVQENDIILKDNGFIILTKKEWNRYMQGVRAYKEFLEKGTITDAIVEAEVEEYATLLPEQAYCFASFLGGDLEILQCGDPSERIIPYSI